MATRHSYNYRGRRGLYNLQPTNVQTNSLNFPLVEFAEYEPKPVDYSIGERSLAKAEDRRYKAAEASATVDFTFSEIGKQLHQDAETASWFEGFKNKYKADIDNYLNEGDYGNAIFYGKQAATAAMKDPELLARIKTNQQYELQKNYATKLLDEGKIGQTTYDRWLEQNDYKFNPILGQDGSVIGGTDYKPNWMPVEQKNMAPFYDGLLRLLGKERGASDAVVFLGEDGKEYSAPPADGQFAIAFKKGTTYERLSANKLKKGFHDLLETMPEYKAYFEQDYKDRLWQFDKASDEEKSSFYNSDIKDANGRDYDFYTYVSKRVNPMLEDMAYNHILSRSNTYDSAYNAMNSYKVTKQKQEQEGFKKQPVDIYSGITSLGQTISRPVTDALQQTYVSLSENLKNVTDILERIRAKSTKGAVRTGKDIFNNPTVKNLLANGDYKGVSNYLKNVTSSAWNQLDDNTRNSLLQSLNNLEDEGKMFSGYLSKFKNKDDKDAIIASLALSGGLNVHNISNNNLAKNYINAENELFKGDNGYSYDNFSIHFVNDFQFNKFLDTLGVSENEISKLGLEIKQRGRLPIVRVNRNNPNIRTIVSAASKFLEGESSVYPGEAPIHYAAELYHTDNEGNSYIDNNSVKKGKKLRQANEAIDIIAKNATFNDDYKKHLEQIFSSEPITIMPIQDYYQRVASANGFDEKKGHGDQQNLMATAMNTIAGGLQNYEVYINGVKVKDKDKEGIKELLGKAYSENRIEGNFAFENIGGSYGMAFVTTPSKSGQAKAEDKATQQIYIKGLLASPSSDAFNSSPSMFYKRKAYLNKFNDVKEKDFLGNNVIWDSPYATNYLAIKDDVRNLLNSTIMLHLNGADNYLSNVDFRTEIEKILNKNGISAPADISQEDLNNPVVVNARTQQINNYIRYREAIFNYITNEFNLINK